MRSKILSLSPALEFFIVVLLTLGVSMSLFALNLYKHGSPNIPNAATSLYLLYYEVGIILFLTCFLYLRGWRRNALPCRLCWGQMGVGLLLWVAIYTVYWLLMSLSNGLVDPKDYSNLFAFHRQLRLPLSASLLILSPLLEELLLLVYVTKALETHGPSVVVANSLLLRLSACLPLGPMAVLFTVPMGVILALYYWRYRQLWPTVVAHVAGNLFAVATL